MPLDNFLDFLEQQDPELVPTALAVAATESDLEAMKQVGISAVEFRNRCDRIAVLRAAFLEQAKGNTARD